MSKREIVISEWNEAIKKAENRLEHSQKCLDLFGDENDRIHVEEDRARLDDLKSKFSRVLEYMDSVGA